MPLITPIKTTFYSSKGTTLPPIHTTIQSVNNRVLGEVRRLTDKKLQHKKEKGLCYRCDDKWNPGHKCKKKELSVLLMQEEEEEEEEEPQTEELVTPDQATTILSGICLNSVLGMTNPKTLKLRGTLVDTEVVVFIDLGATHNFMSLAVIKKLHIPITPTAGFGVSLGTGKTVSSRGRCQGILLQVQGLGIKEDFLPLILGSSDVNGQWVTLRGEPSLEHAMISLKTMVRTIGSVGGGYIVHCNHLERQSASPTLPASPPYLTQVIQRFDEVFNWKGGLPPPRTQQHTISLKEGVEPVSPSRSPFNSPALLVKKKDESWRFCVDYRSLNKVTIKDRFPIPVIEELLDELHGSRIFSKLDLKSVYHQIRMKKEDVPKTAFRTHEVLELLYKHELYANPGKYELGKCQIAYLGHVVSERGVAVDEEKIKAVVAWPLLSKVKELRGFLGLTGYYRKFIVRYAKIAAPLTDQLRKDCFSWNEEATEAFTKLKSALTNTPILAMPDFTKMFVVETDASGKGLGAV
uniref:Reverse transcriptase/retrotransposon-derived protein RNase H-like domain-containing protein n=1 Tax=Lactuca sativa TaxID=4236 RepID=A0A9R1W0L2_LACSA|nr:hypothetical protein LSAT_V11C300156310 [Lactuca sativa]